MAESFEKTIQALMSGVEEHLTTKTVIGEPIKCEDTIIFPMADVAFGIAAGAGTQEKKNNGAGGVGAKMTPTAVLVLQNGSSKIISIKDKDAINKLVDMLPDIVNKIAGIIQSRSEDKEGVEDTEDAEALGTEEIAEPCDNLNK